MGNVHPEIDEDLKAFIEAQQMFFVATAPSEGGRVNMSPKGLDSFAVLGSREVAYVDLTGSGVETMAHLRQNGRITFMFCAFTGKPNIVRLYGQGTTVRPGEDGFDDLAANFGEFKGLRSIVHAQIDRVSDSCGYGVPLMTYTEDRRALLAWADKKTPEALADYQQLKNAQSIDGLRGV